MYTTNPCQGTHVYSNTVTSVAAVLLLDHTRVIAAGHSSWSAAGLGYLTFFLWDVLTPMDGGGHAWRLVVALLPAAGALAVGITRYMDYWHHWTDVLAGLTLGFVIAWLTFSQQQAKFVRLERQQSSSQALLLGEDIEAQQVVPLRGMQPPGVGY